MLVRPLVTKKYGNFVDFPAFIFATVTLTTIEVDGIAVTVMILTETAGVNVEKNVDVFVLGVKKVVVVAEIVENRVVTGTVSVNLPLMNKQIHNPIKFRRLLL